MINSSNSYLFTILWDVKELMHYAKRVGHWGSQCCGLTLLSGSQAKHGQLRVMFPKRLVVYEATLAKTDTSQRDAAKSQIM